MTFQIHTLVLGPIQNNTFVIADSESNQAVIIDPAAPSKQITSLLAEKGLALSAIWITHAHFDHIGGVKWLRSQFETTTPVYMNAADLDLWNSAGGAHDFGFDFDPGEPPDNIVVDGQKLFVGGIEFTALHTPGHSLGHLTFYSAKSAVAFCGDLIFHHSIGRTDLDVGNESELFRSIREKILTLPEETRLYPGHGSFTSVKEEKENNPFL